MRRYWDSFSPVFGRIDCGTGADGVAHLYMILLDTPHRSVYSIRSPGSPGLPPTCSILYYFWISACQLNFSYLLLGSEQLMLKVLTHESSLFPLLFSHKLRQCLPLPYQRRTRLSLIAVRIPYW